MQKKILTPLSKNLTVVVGFYKESICDKSLLNVMFQMSKANYLGFATVKPASHCMI